MVTILYNAQRDKIFEQYDNDPYYFWNGAFRYQAVHFLGEELVILDIIGSPSIPQKTIPFGKYKGYLVYDAPDEYLRWLTSVAYGPLKFWCEEESNRRFGGIQPPSSRTYSGTYPHYDYDELCEMHGDFMCENWGDRD